MGLSDDEKEHLIALYLVQEYSRGGFSRETEETASRTTPNPEMAHDLLLLVRRLDNG